VAVEGVSGLPSGLVGKVIIGCWGRGTVKCRDRVQGSGTGAEGVASIPAESLVEGDGDRGVVYTVDAAGKRARRLAVRLVGLDGDRVLVRGLDGVTRVVSAGASWLTDSARVEIRP